MNELSSERLQADPPRIGFHSLDSSEEYGNRLARVSQSAAAAAAAGLRRAGGRTVAAPGDRTVAPAGRRARPGQHRPCDRRLPPGRSRSPARGNTPPRRRWERLGRSEAQDSRALQDSIAA